jgi:hypothetical protein
MKKLPRIASAEVVVHGVLKVVFTDGFEGVVDVRPLIATGPVFEHLRDPANFHEVGIDDFGHALVWKDRRGAVIELGADSLRRDCERQAEIHKLMAG